MSDGWTHTYGESHVGKSWNIMLIQDFFIIRRRLAGLEFLIRRPRGRKILGVKTIQRKMSFYDVAVNLTDGIFGSAKKLGN